MPGGTAAGLKAIQRQDLVAFHDRYFVGGNLVVALVGDLDRNQAEAVAEQVAGALPAGPRAPNPGSVAAQTGAERRIAFPSSQSHLLLGQPAIARDNPDYFPLLVGNHILGGGGLVSRLSQAIRADQGLAYSVSSYFVPMRGPGPFTVRLQTRGERAGEALKITRQTLEHFIAEGPEPQELEDARKNLVGSFVLGLDSNRKLAGTLSAMGFYDLPLDYLTTYRDRVSAVTAKSIRAAFRRHLDLGRLVTVRVGGEADG